MNERERGLFENSPTQAVPKRDDGGPRVVTAERTGIEFRRFEFDALIGEDHPARTIWAYVEALDLGDLYARIEARTHTVGRPATDPRVLLALWLYACVEGIGSARAVERLSEQHHGYIWLRGGVPLNYHLLADVRLAAAALVDRLLTEGVAALAAEELVTLETLAQDGMRVRAAAGASSYRRQPRLEQLLAEAEQRIAALKAEIDADPDAANKRRRAARERAARERKGRVASALDRLKQAKAAKTAAAKPDAPAENHDKLRVSTTDSEARVMRMSDGGWRPAYNPQIVSDLESGLILDVSIDTTGSDAGLMAPALAAVERRYGRRPARWLADGGYVQLDDIAAVAAAGVAVFVPPKPRRNPKNDPAKPRPGDPPAVADWRRRMAADAKAGANGQPSWLRRRSEAERVNSEMRRRGLRHFAVRGVAKVLAITRLAALAHNIITAARLRTASA